MKNIHKINIRIMKNDENTEKQEKYVVMQYKLLYDSYNILPQMWNKKRKGDQIHYIKEKES